MICLLSESNLSELESGLNIEPQQSSFVAADEHNFCQVLSTIRLHRNKQTPLHSPLDQSYTANDNAPKRAHPFPHPNRGFAVVASLSRNLTLKW